MGIIFFKKDYTFKLFFFPVISFITYFLYRIIDQTQMIRNYSFEAINDISGYMAVLHFYSIYGYNAFVPNWYSGIYLFSAYPPGAFFVLSPILKVFQNIGLTFYLSLLIFYLLIIFLIYKIGKLYNLSKFKTLVFCCLYLFNPVLVSHFVRMMRIPSLIGVFFMIFLFFLTFYYVNKKISYKFVLLFALLYASLLITHPPEFILFNFFLLGFIFFKNDSCERIRLFMGVGLGIILSSFWLIPFVKYSISHSVLLNYGLYFTQFNSITISTQLTNFFLPLLLILTYLLFYYTNESNRNECIIYYPILFLAVLHLLRLTIFVPIIKYLYGPPYSNFFLFFVLYFLIRLDFNKFSKNFKNILFYIAVLFTILIIITGFIFTPSFKKATDFDNKMVDVLTKVRHSYTILGDLPNDSFSKAFYSYGAIYLNLSTSDGWAPQYMTKEYSDKLAKLHASSISNCLELKNNLDWFKIRDIISTNNDCAILENCGLEAVYVNGSICLMRLN